jgi:hypothetical protein
LSLFLFGIVQFGIAYDMKQSINSAAREGARTAAIPTTNFTAIDASLRNSYSGLVDDNEVTVRVDNTATSYSAQRVGSSSPTGDAVGDGDPSAERTPCERNGPVAGEGTVVVVRAEVKHELTIPFFGAPEITLEGKGEFRCERQD